MSRSEFAGFLEAENHRLIRYVRSRLQETAELDAEDVVQDVLARVLERADITLPFEELAAYIYRSLHNRIIDFFRTRKNTLPLQGGNREDDPGLIEVLREKRPDALQVLQSGEGREQLFEALATLSGMEQRVVIAHDLEGRKFRELAEAWGVPQNTLLSHKARALEKLRRYFAEHQF